MRSEPTQDPRRHPGARVATRAVIGDHAPTMGGESGKGGPAEDIARLLARLEDTAWITAQAISVGRRSGPGATGVNYACNSTARLRSSALPLDTVARAPRRVARGRGTAARIDVQVGGAGAAPGDCAGTVDERRSRTLEPAARALLDALPLPVLWLDPQGVVRHCNASALACLGTPLLGVAWRDVVALRLARRLPVMSVASNAYRNGQLVLLSPGDQHDPSSRRHAPVSLHDAVGLPAGSAGADAAVAEQERIRERQLVRLGRVSAGLAHQLRTPIAATQLYLDLAAASGDRSYLDKAQSSLDALTHHCESVLTLARGELRQAADATLASVLSLVQRQALALRGSLQVEAPAQPVPMPCNPHLLAGAVLNLVDNAMRASPGAVARLVATAGADGVCITVIDDGDGLPEALRIRLGQPLPSSRPEGSGFGLAMASMIVEAHGGRLRIDSQPGCGTRACVLLPAGNASAARNADLAQ